MYIEVNGWETGIRFSASHMIIGHEKCSRLHGHQYAVHCKLSGEPGPDGLVMDFMALKKVLRGIADELDHRVLLPGNSDNMKITSDDGQVAIDTGEKSYSLPMDDVVILDTRTASAEELSGLVLKRLMQVMDIPSSVHIIEIGISEGIGQTAWSSWSRKNQRF